MKNPLHDPVIRMFALAFVMGAGAPVRVHAQSPTQSPQGTQSSVIAQHPGLAAPSPLRAVQVTREDFSFLASLAVPGSGQYVMHQQRWLPYVAVEAWAWVRYLDRRSTARELSRQYKDFAWDVARRVSTGARQDTTFPYYEILIHYPASGAYDAQPSQAGIQPEFDLSTYNGQQWDLAQRLFIPVGSAGDVSSPGYISALNYYAARAIPDAFAFAWNTGRLEQQVYSNVITDSDGAYRDATRMLGLILANHLTSAVDALISSRLRSGGANLRFESGLTPESTPRRPGTVLRLDAKLQYRW